MAKSVSLADIIETLEMQFEETSSFVDPETGEVHTLSRQMMNHAERGTTPEFLPDWQKDEFQIAQLMVNTGRFLRLPTKWDVHEWEIMQEFALQVEFEPAREELLNSLRGTGAFRYFKDTLRRRRMESQWYEFRSVALTQIAIEWCRENDIAWHV